MSDTRTIIMHGFQPEEVLAAMRAIKAALPSAADAAFATSTETNVEWKLGELLEHVAEEHRRARGAMRKA